MIRHIVIAIAILAAGASSAWADKWADPTPRVFASQYGSFGLKCLEPKLLGPSKGVLFTLGKDGAEKTLWEAAFPNTPHQVFVADNGRFVVTIDTWGVLGSDHSLVIYNSRGKQIKSFRLEDLLRADEIKAWVKHTVSSRWWAEGAVFQFADGNIFQIRLSWGKQVRIRLDTGMIENTEKP